MKNLLLLLAFEAAVAFPTIPGFNAPLEPRELPGKRGCTISQQCKNAAAKVPLVKDSEIGYDPNNLTPAQQVSAARTNCGIQGPCLIFDPTEQLVDVSGQYLFHGPRKGDIRGPCPGLNAAANHGYLARSGVATIADTTNGLAAAYGMSQEFGLFLAAFSIAIAGDAISQTWSIGGPQEVDIPMGLVAAPQGISYSHNKYEGDVSIGRCDAYQNQGNAHSLSVERFATAWASCTDNDCTLDKFARDFAKKTLVSIRTNPLYTAPFVSTTIVSPAAYNFVINFMSNHSAENPNGFLTKDVFQTFFAVSGKTPSKFKWNPGMERIPYQWYRRPGIPVAVEYTPVEGLVGDCAAQFAAYPTSFRFGGNTHGKNSYVGIDIGNFTGGAFNQGDLSSKQGLSCFFYEFAQAFFPAQIASGPNGKGSAAKKAEELLFGALAQAFSTVAGCPKVEKFNDNLFGKYPGYKYSPKGTPGQAC